MDTFADDVSSSILAAPGFWQDLDLLRSSGTFATLPHGAQADTDANVAVSRDMPLDAIARLLSSASVLALTESERSREIAQQIAIFSTQVSQNPGIVDGAVHVLAQLGNFPGLSQVEPKEPTNLTVQTYLRSRLLAEINSVEVAGTKRALTDFQHRVWEKLGTDPSLAISAPTSAGKSFVVLEHLRAATLERQRFVGIYIAPTRALIAEVHRTLEQRIGDLNGTLRVTTLPIPDADQRPRQIYVLTQERLQILLSSLKLADVIDLVIVDEAQAIADGHRGMILQDVLERVQERSHRARFLFLAPGAEGFIEMGEAVGVPRLDVMATMLSPVVQNRIVVSYDSYADHRLRLSLLDSDGVSKPIGDYISTRGFAVDERRKLALVALELGQDGRSLVYATGPARAEKIARQLYVERQPSTMLSRQARREELANFIEKDIHREYSLAKHVRHGVAFHYANMPSLLREGIEGAFRDGHLDFLCCTTTLFQGVNLPARNVFIDTPERGQKGELLDAASLWNFAGRAGRLGKDVVGNVFLVNYENWETQPLSKRKPFELTVAFQEAIVEDYYDVMQVLKSARTRTRADEAPSERAKAAAGFALHRAAEDSLRALLQRPGKKLDPQHAQALQASVAETLETLKLPAEVLANNWGVEPLALAEMMTRLRKAISDNDIQSLLPIHPTSPNSYTVYKTIIFKMHKYFAGWSFAGENKKRAGFVNHLTVIALKWMQGVPLSALVKAAVAYELKQAGKDAKRQTVIDIAVRKLFSLVEKEVRFELVRWARAYVDLLKVALLEAGHKKHAEELYDFALALELGISTTTGRSLMELGLSRITSASVAAIINDSSLDAEKVRAWISERAELLQDELSELVVTELRERGLLQLSGL